MTGSRARASTPATAICVDAIVTLSWVWVPVMKRRIQPRAMPYEAVAPRQASCAGRDAANSAEETTSHTPMTIATPIAPMITPTRRRAVIRSLGSTTTATSVVHSGVVAFRMADSPDGRL